VSGHRGLPAATERLVVAALRVEVAKHSAGHLVGVSSLADGADSLFAQVVLDAGGSLVLIVPAKTYRDVVPASHRATYDALLDRAAEVIELDHLEPDPEAYMDAGRRMLEQADELLAVWDGKPARGFGGTADVVAAARQRGLPVTIIWPAGATRD
jgi:hypothetical protein